jgi:hypothetical protein
MTATAASFIMPHLGRFARDADTIRHSVVKGRGLQFTSTVLSPGVCGDRRSSESSSTYISGGGPRHVTRVVFHLRTIRPESYSRCGCSDIFMEDQGSNTAQKVSKNLTSRLKKVFTRVRAEAPPSSASAGASSAGDATPVPRAAPGPTSLSKEATQPLQAKPILVPSTKHLAPKVYSSLWEKALDLLKESDRKSERDAYKQLQRMLEQPEALSLQDVHKAHEDDLKNLSSKRDQQRFGSRRYVIRAARYMLLLRGPASAAGRFDATGAATIGVQASTSLTSVSLFKYDLVVIASSVASPALQTMSPSAGCYHRQHPISRREIIGCESPRVTRVLLGNSARASGRVAEWISQGGKRLGETESAGTAEAGAQISKLD